MDFKLLIKLQINEKNQKLNNQNIIMKKAKAKAKIQIFINYNIN